MRILTLSGLCLFLATPALAQGASGASSAMIERLRAADTNHDGVVERAEFIAYRAGNFSRLDRNGNGILEEKDIPSFLRGRGGPLDFAALKSQFDANHDGVISRQEFVNGPTSIFDLADANHDGRVTLAELDAAVTRARATRKG